MVTDRAWNGYRKGLVWLQVGPCMVTGRALYGYR